MTLLTHLLLRRLRVSMSSLTCAISLAGAAAAADPVRPNIIVILSDDMGYGDVGCFGSKEISTPHLDRLAAEGVKFTNAYVSAPICVASRMGLLSGRYQQRYGIYDNIYGRERNRGFRNQRLLPEILRAAGYRTGLVGKWHLAGIRKGEPSYAPGGPLARGFDEYAGFLLGDSEFWEGAPLMRNDLPYPAPRYLTDHFGDEATAFIARNRANPFFLYMAFNAPHAPLHAVEADLKEFAGIADENRRIYAAMLRAVDRNVGRILRQLDEFGLAENTLVVFLNDNGGGGSTDEYAWHSRNYASNAPFRGHKFDVYEGGIRVPMIVRWPRGEFRGQVFGSMVSSMDVLPTALATAGVAAADLSTDGVDLRRYVSGQVATPPHPWLCWQNRTWAVRKPGGTVLPNVNEMEHSSAIRMGDWKLVRIAERTDSFGAAPAWELYDLANDPGESHDLAAQQPEKVAELERVFLAWRADMAPSLE